MFKCAVEKIKDDPQIRSRPLLITQLFHGQFIKTIFVPAQNLATGLCPANFENCDQSRLCRSILHKSNSLPSYSHLPRLNDDKISLEIIFLKIIENFVELLIYFRC